MSRKPPILGSASQAAAGTRVTQVSIDKGEDKENGPGAMAGVGTAASITSASRAMSSLYLLGPLPALRDTGNKLCCVTQSQNRFPLPVGKSILGRNSIRDSFPGNSNKIRIGIDTLEEVTPRNLIPVVDVSRCRIGNYTSRREGGPSFLAFSGAYFMKNPCVYTGRSFVEIYPVFFAPLFLALPYEVFLSFTLCSR